MTIEYCFLEETDICYARYIGLTTSGDLQENYGRYVVDPHYRPGRTELIDLSLGDFDAITYASLTPLATIVNDINVNAGTHTATFVYAPSSVSFGTTRMYASITAEMKGLSIYQAKTEQEVLKLMGLPYPNIASFLRSQTIIPAATGSGGLMAEYKTA